MNRGSTYIGNTILEDLASNLGFDLFLFDDEAINVNLKDTTGVTAELNATIDTAVTGIATPVDYVQIILLVLVFAAIIGVLVFKFGRGGGKSDF